MISAPEAVSCGATLFHIPIPIKPTKPRKIPVYRTVFLLNISTPFTYDMNPVPDSHGLKLNVGQADNALDLELARSVAGYFRVPVKQADETIVRCKEVVRQWPTVAQSLRIPDREQQRMAGAFKLAD